MEIKNKPLEYMGEIIVVGEREEFGSNGFAKRSVIISPNPRDEHVRMLQVVFTTSRQEDRTNLITKKDIGKIVKVTAFVETRKWVSKTTGKEGYINEANGWKVEFQGKTETPPPAEPEDIGDVDDMPF